MGLESLEREIRGSFTAKAAGIGREAEKKAAEITDSAKESAAKSLATARLEAEKGVHDEQSEQVSSAHLEAGKIISNAKNEAVNEGARQVWAEFSKASHGKEYAKTLKKLILSGISEIGRHSIVRVRKSDASLAKKIGHAPSKSPIECTGGAIIERHDGKVSSDKTFEAIFEEKKDFVRAKVHEKLF